MSPARRNDALGVTNKLRAREGLPALKIRDLIWPALQEQILADSLRFGGECYVQQKVLEDASLINERSGLGGRTGLGGTGTSSLAGRRAGLGGTTSTGEDERPGLGGRTGLGGTGTSTLAGRRAGLGGTTSTGEDELLKTVDQLVGFIPHLPTYTDLVLLAAVVHTPLVPGYTLYRQ